MKLSRHLAPYFIKSSNHGLFKSQFFQPQLSIHSPSDNYELEADRIAENYQQNTKPTFFQPKITPIPNISAINNNNTFEVSDYLSKNAGKGNPLNQNVKQSFESYLGTDFSDVKIHTNEGAIHSANAINAKAYTSGKDIVFNHNEYNPNSSDGQKLIAHELTHVIQQSVGNTKKIQREPISESFAANMPKEGIYLKVKPSHDADNFPGDKLMPGDKILIKNTGGAATYNNVKNGQWSWIEVPGKKSTDKAYKVLHGFIPNTYIHTKEVKIEPPKSHTQEKVTSIDGPEIVYSGGSFQYSAQAHLADGTQLKEGEVNWAYQFDQGTITTVPAKGSSLAPNNNSVLFIKIDEGIKKTNFKVYAYTGSKPIDSISKTSSLSSVQFVVSKKDKGKKLDGTEADDLLTNDFTKEDIQKAGAGWWPDDLFDIKTDEELFQMMKDMGSTYFSVGEMETNNLAMIDHFQKNTGNDYSSSILTKALQEHASTKRFVERAKVILAERIKLEGEGLSQKPITKGELEKARPVFNTNSDTFAGGLTFAINDTWAHQVELTYYDFVNENDYKGKMKVTLYDNFGLDKPDIEKKFGYMEGFRAWFILQHVRGYKPFVTVIEFDVEFTKSDLDKAVMHREKELKQQEQNKKEEEFRQKQLEQSMKRPHPGKI